MTETISAALIDERINRFVDMLSEHREERAELAAAGIDQQRIDALYPLDFSAMIESVCEQLVQRGTDHLHLTRQLEGEWAQQIASARQMRASFAWDEKDRYDIQWAKHYTKSLASSSSEYWLYWAIMNQIRRSGYHDGTASAFAEWYAKLLFTCYWLVLNPRTLASQLHYGLEMLDWVAFKLLP